MDNDPPGFAVTIGAENYQAMFTDPALRPVHPGLSLDGHFALLSVFLTFVLGMFLAIVFDVPEMPMRSLLRSLLLIPYTIPAFVAVPVWVGLLNPQFGVISQMTGHLWLGAALVLGSLLGEGRHPAHPAWLGFPYMFVIVTGALQTLPDRRL